MSGRLDIHTDGGCIGNPGPGGWAFVIMFDGTLVEGSGFSLQTTNNRMELTAVREALKEIESRPQWKGLPVSVTTDSRYVQQGISEWIHSWIRNGWRTSGKKPVKNSDLWLELWELSRRRSISWNWVMGHSGDRGNEACHRLVEEAIKRRA
jgi:ribonuclease HI